MRCQEDGCEAEEGGQAGGVSAAAFAIPVKDVDLGRLKVEAGIDLNHRAGPSGGGREAGVGWGTRLLCWDPGKGGEPDRMGSVKPPLGVRQWWGMQGGGPGVTGLGKKSVQVDEGQAKQPHRPLRQPFIIFLGAVLAADHTDILLPSHHFNPARTSE